MKRQSAKKCSSLVEELADHMDALHPDRYVQAGKDQYMFRVVSPKSAVLFFRNSDYMMHLKRKIEETLARHEEIGAITTITVNTPIPKIYKGKPPFELHLGFDHAPNIGHALWLKLLERNVNPEEHAYFPLLERESWDDGFRAWADEKKLLSAHQLALKNNETTLKHLENIVDELSRGRLSPQAQDFLKTRAHASGAYTVAQEHVENLIGSNPLLCGHPRVANSVWKRMSTALRVLFDQMGFKRQPSRSKPQLALLAEVRMHDVLERLLPVTQNDRKTIAERKNVIQSAMVRLQEQNEYNHVAVDALTNTRKQLDEVYEPHDS